MLVARRVVTQEVLVLRENDSILRQGERDVLGIGSSDQVGIGRWAWGRGQALCSVFRWSGGASPGSGLVFGFREV